MLTALPEAKEPSVSVVIPVYRSEVTLNQLHERLTLALTALELPYEIILVEDCGNDGSWATIDRLAHEHASVVGIRLARNYGQHNALLCGIRAARGSVVVTLDDDLQHPPEEIGRLLEKLKDGNDVVYGYPLTQQHSLLRGLASQITKLALANIMGADTARNVSAFRVFRTSIRDAFANYRGPFVSIDVLLTWGASRFVAVRVRHEPRRVGQSNYTVGKLINHGLNMMTGFSVLPLQLASIMGFTFTLVGLALLLYIVGCYLWQGTSVPGFPFLASMIAIFSGAQLFSLGMIGEYLSRMHFRTMERPPYVVAETAGGSRFAEEAP